MSKTTNKETDNKTQNHKCQVLAEKCGFLFKFFEWKLCIAKKLSFIPSLCARLLIAKVFWASGVLKLPAGFLGIGMGNWDSTILLFTEEYHVPLLKPEIAAYMSATFEILCPILLVLGLGTRVAAFFLLCMTIVIEFTYQHDIAHLFWGTSLLFLLTGGGGCLSIDCFIRKKALSCPEYNKMACVGVGDKK